MRWWVRYRSYQPGTRRDNYAPHRVRVALADAAAVFGIGMAGFVIVGLIGAAVVLLTAACGAPTAPHSPIDDRPGVKAPATAETPSTVICHVLDGRADRRCTPGALNPAVTQTNIAQTICTPGWTDSVRPPSSYTTALKRKQMRDYGETGFLSSYAEDHLVSLSAGGAPTNPANLFPQPSDAAHIKDQDENAVHRAICAGRITLKQGQDQLLLKWSHP